MEGVAVDGLESGDVCFLRVLSCVFVAYVFLRRHLVSKVDDPLGLAGERQPSAEGHEL